MTSKYHPIFHKTRTPVRAIFLIGAVSVLACCNTKNSLPPADSDNGGLALPDGFGAVVVVDSIGNARHIAVSESNDIYVRLSRSKDKKPSNVALRDTDNDGKADSIIKFGDIDTLSYASNCMRIHNGYLYFGSDLELYRQNLVPGQLVPENKTDTVFTDDHQHGRHWHITKPVSFDDKGNMYLPFGSPSNACQDIVNTPGGAQGVPGLDPCPELEQHGGVWVFDANKTNLTQKDGKRFATGIRSVVAIDWNPADKKLYIVMHGRDDLHLLWPEKFNEWQSAVLPAEELMQVNEGDDFGWPYCYYDQLQKKKVLAPEYGGDGKLTGRCENVKSPVMGFPGHWAPNDLLFYRGNQFPDHYKNGAFVAFHGSTNRSPYPQAGYFVCFIPFKDGRPSGDWEVFANGFAQIDPIENVSDAVYRPMGLAEGPDGSLYISETNKGKIWRVMYTGARDNFGKDQLAAMEKHKSFSNIRTPHEINDNLYKGNTLPGAKVYARYCSPCHQRNGRGDANRFPPLDSSEWVYGNKGRLIDAVMNGLNKPITVKGKPYNNVMPPHRFLKDGDMAALLTYVRKSFGNNADPVTPEEIAEVRRQTEKK